MSMPFANLRTFLRTCPNAHITKVDHAGGCIFFTEKGRQWVMIFDGEKVDGVWNMCPAQDDWNETTAAASTRAVFGGWKA
tara:strand:+ start:376 stop:615 length:240 start_codon:yes stop_codon:yes gene_type:complete